MSQNVALKPSLLKLALKPDVILGAPASAALALHRETRTIPVVFAQVPDPVGLGMVESLSRPGGNITGFALFEYAIALKWLELLKQIAPHVTRAGLLYDPSSQLRPRISRRLKRLRHHSKSKSCRMQCATQKLSSAPSPHSRQGQMAAS
jgi:ABC-type uncharacterized transport system substrate-binding protein